MATLGTQSSGPMGDIECWTRRSGRAALRVVGGAKDEQKTATCGAR